MAQERTEINEKYKWDLSPLYPSTDEWRKAKEQVVSKMNLLASYKGTIGRSAQDMKRFLLLDTEIDMTIGRLSVYTSLLADEDVSIAENQALSKELELMMVDYHQQMAFVLPEMSAISAETYEKFIAEEPALEPYRMNIDRIVRNKQHTLSDIEEELMAKVSILGSPSSDTYDIFTNADMPHPSITLEDGTEVELDQSAFAQLRASANRKDRETAFEAFWTNYCKFEGTFGEMMNGNIREGIFSAKARKYDSCLGMALNYNKIPVGVYHSLIENVNRNLPTFHRYLNLKRRLLNVDELKYSDLYAPAVAEADLQYTYEEAQKLVLEALQPLGEDYVSVVKRAFDERWLDVMPSRGKATGAYSNGGAYDVHPYILMNYNGLYDHVGTLIHELGHTMQSYYSNKTQPFPTHDYSIFVAEVASTFNECLLDHLMLNKLTDPKQKICLLMSMLDGFKGTLFRQTQFAEFQLKMYEKAEAGEPITGKALTELYGDITRRYYGHDKGVCTVPDVVNIEWAFIPHFYMGFYVYQYSTSFIASQALSEMVLAGDKEALERYMGFLAAGDSKYPIDELNDAGVDMLSAEPFDKAIEKMNALIDEIEKLLD